MAVSRSWLFAATAAIAMTSSAFVAADPHGRHWRGDFHPGHDHWHNGHWYHGDHEGRFGWWWIAAGSWYFYPAPIYPYSSQYAAPPIIIEREAEPITAVPPAEAVWYYCASSRSYYPYVSDCPEGWRIVPAQPRDAYER